MCMLRARRAYTAFFNLEKEVLILSLSDIIVEFEMLCATDRQNESPRAELGTGLLGLESLDRNLENLEGLINGSSSTTRVSDLPGQRRPSHGLTGIVWEPEVVVVTRPAVSRDIVTRC